MDGDTDTPAVPVPPITAPAPALLDAPDAANPPSILLDTVLLLLLRVLFFYLARRYLLAQLNPALRELQKPDVTLPTHHIQRARNRDRANSRASVVSFRSTHSGRSVASSIAGSSAPRALPVQGGVGRAPSVHSTPSVSPAPLPSDVDDTDDIDDTDEPSSYPASEDGTPRIKTIHITRGDATPPLEGPAAGGEAIGMGLLGAKLRDTSGGGRPQVLELSHARTETAGSRAGKRTARGLGRVARALFSVCFAESMNLLTLVVFQALGILGARARQVNFGVSLYVLLALILLLVPLVECLLFTYRSRESNSNSASTSATTRSMASLSLTSRLLIAALPFVLYIFLFTRIPPYITVMDDWEGGGWLAASLGRVVVLGVLIMASLSGIGAVKTAWDYLEQAAGGGHKISDADVLQAERSLYRVRQDLVAKRDELNRLASALPERAGWMGGVFGGKGGQPAARAELQGLQAMEVELTRSLAGMKAKQKRQNFRDTWTGSVVNILGYLFAVYCAARLVMCLMSLFAAPLSTSAIENSDARGNTNGDWISFIIALGLKHLPFTGDLDTAAWSRGIALLLTGLLILSSLAMVLRWLTRVLRLTSRTVGAGFLLLTLGQLYATYVISLLVQLRSAMPAVATAPDTDHSHSHHTDESLLRSLPDFRVFGRLFDAVFLVAALGTIVFRYIAMHVERSDDGAVFGVGR